MQDLTNHTHTLCTDRALHLLKQKTGYNWNSGTQLTAHYLIWPH